MSPTVAAGFIPVSYFTVEQLRVYKALKERRMFKFICGASYSDFNAVLNFSKVFSRAGAHLIDVAAHPTIVSAAREGIENSGISPEKSPAIMVSLSLDHQQDPHFRRVALDTKACDTCGACIMDCPTQAFSIKDRQLQYQKERCYGCGACVPLCHVDALTPEPLAAFQPSVLPELWQLGARALEIHVGPNFYWLEPYLHKIKEISPEPWLLSICLGSSFASYSELQEQGQEIYNLLGADAIVQIDGKAMSGHQRADSNMLQALAGAQALLELEKPLYVQVSGGANDRIRDLLDQFGIRAHGVGMGGYAKKLIDPYLGDTETAVGIASKLVASIRPR
ncbi:MAG: LdpA C-terminal domain-containing domain [Candidatus Caenarcaniphilales bacterium]|nr:LdpA C-terminal domain-containing domain [Candidatus Caenarcaniphilales bacterium]